MPTNIPIDTEQLNKLALDSGATWATEVRNELRKRGRAATGMWPGTLTEARGVAARVLHRAGFRMSAAQREDLARAVYAAARGNWLEARDPDENGGEDD